MNCCDPNLLFLHVLSHSLLLVLLLFVSQLISEFVPNPPGTDPATVSVELLGTPGESFTGCLVTVECDDIGERGIIDRAADLSGTFDANGLLVVDTVPDVENPSIMLFLLSGTCPSTGVQADTVISPANTLDAIGIPDQPEDERLCIPATVDLGLDFPTFPYLGGFPQDEPELIFRDPNTLEWFAVFEIGTGPIYDITGTEVDPATFFGTDPTQTTFDAPNPTTVNPDVTSCLEEPQALSCPLPTKSGKGRGRNGNGNGAPMIMPPMGFPICIFNANNATSASGKGSNGQRRRNRARELRANGNGGRMGKGSVKEPFFETRCVGGTREEILEELEEDEFFVSCGCCSPVDEGDGWPVELCAEALLETCTA